MSPVSEAHIASFQLDGFVVIPDLLAEAEILEYGAQVDAAVASRMAWDTRHLQEKTRYEQSFQQCINLWEDYPAVRPLTFHPRIGEAAARLLGVSAIRLWHDQALYKEAGGRETEMHQDQPYWPIAERDSLTAWIPLVEIDEQMGCMGYIPGSHKGKLTFIDVFTTPGQGQEFERRQIGKPVFVTGRPGDVLFHHGGTIHCAKPNRSERVRRVHTAIYFRDGCTRRNDRPHHSLDRDSIAVGAPIDGRATPIAWPLPGGRLPEPIPFPEVEAHGALGNPTEIGVFPRARG